MSTPISQTATIPDLAGHPADAVWCKAFEEHHNVTESLLQSAQAEIVALREALTVVRRRICNGESQAFVAHDIDPLLSRTSSDYAGKTIIGVEELAGLHTEIKRLEDYLSAFEWRRINNMDIKEVEAELLAEGHTKESLDKGLEKIREMCRKAAIDAQKEVTP